MDFILDLEVKRQGQLIAQMQQNFDSKHQEVMNYLYALRQDIDALKTKLLASHS